MKNLGTLSNAMTISPENIDISIIFLIAISIWANIEAENFINSFKSDLNLSSSFLNLIGRILQKTGKGSIALRYYKKALTGSIKDSDTLNNIGTLFFEKKKICPSIKIFGESIRLNSTNNRAKVNLAYSAYNTEL